MASKEKQTAIKKIQARHKKRAEKKSIGRLLSFVIAFIIALLIALVAVVYLNSTGIYETGILEVNKSSSSIKQTYNDELEAHDVVMSPKSQSPDLEQNITSGATIDSVIAVPNLTEVDEGTMSLDEIEAKEAEVERIIKAQEEQDRVQEEQKKSNTSN